MIYCKRYNGEDLEDEPHIVVLGSCKVGNFIATIPLLQALRRTYPQARIDFWGSEATKDLEEALCEVEEEHLRSRRLINWRVSWDKVSTNRMLELGNRIKERGNPSLVINCDGFNPITKTLAAWMMPKWIVGASIDIEGRKDLEWGNKPQQAFLKDDDWETIDFKERYKEYLEDQYIGNLMCFMTFIEPNKDDMKIALPYRKPKYKVPSLLIHCTTTRKAKMWSRDKWEKVISWCSDNEISVGIVGAAPDIQKKYYNSGNDEDYLINIFKEKYLSNGEKLLSDLRGKTSLIELVGACRQAKAVISVDAGPLHIAAASGVPVLAIVGSDKEGIGASPIRLWMPRSSNVSRTISNQSCNKCLVNRFKNDSCVLDEHECMNGIRTEEVINWLMNAIG